MIQPIASQLPSSIRIDVTSSTLPTGVTGLPGAKHHSTHGRYEAKIILSGSMTGQFKGTVYPDNMDVKGHIANGSYRIFLGFHKPGVPKKSDLIVRTNGFRAVIVVERGLDVPAESNDPTKVTADGVHIHNGWRHWTAGHPMSDGCLLLYPSDWTRFISKFLKAFPNLSDWSTNGSRVGREIGTLNVQITQPIPLEHESTGATHLANTTHK